MCKEDVCSPRNKRTKQVPFPASRAERGWQTLRSQTPLLKSGMWCANWVNGEGKYWYWKLVYTSSLWFQLFLVMFWILSSDQKLWKWGLELLVANCVQEIATITPPASRALAYTKPSSPSKRHYWARCLSGLLRSRITDNWKSVWQV